MSQVLDTQRGRFATVLSDTEEHNGVVYILVEHDNGDLEDFIRDSFIQMIINEDRFIAV